MGDRSVRIVPNRAYRKHLYEHSKFRRMMSPDDARADAPPGSRQPPADDSTQSGRWDAVWILLPIVVFVVLFVAMAFLAS